MIWHLLPHMVAVILKKVRGRSEVCFFRPFSFEILRGGMEKNDFRDIHDIHAWNAHSILWGNRKVYKANFTNFQTPPPPKTNGHPKGWEDLRSEHSAILLHSEKKGDKTAPLGELLILAIRNLATLGVLFWHPIDRRVLLAHKKRLKTVPPTLKGAKMVPL